MGDQRPHMMCGFMVPHTHPFNGPLSGTTRVSRYQKCNTNLDFTEARDSEWQRHQLGHMQVCTSLQTDNHASTPPLSFVQARCPSCRPTNSVKALKASVVPWSHPSQYPKWHTNRFGWTSHFVEAHECDQQTNTRTCRQTTEHQEK